MIDCSGKTRLALHIPSPYELESVNIIITIIMLQVKVISILISIVHNHKGCPVDVVN